jgi:nitronate monooxygenase
MAIQNQLTQTLGIDKPVLLAPMDVVSGGRLASAVSDAGGLGPIGGGYGCGFITWNLAKHPGVLDRALAHAQPQ